MTSYYGPDEDVDDYRDDGSDHGVASAVIPGFKETRRLRFARRQRSSQFLISDARRKAGFDDPDTPEKVPSRLPDGELNPDWVNPPVPAKCRWRVAEEVSVHHDGVVDSPAHFSGLQRCASISACPVCSAVIRAGRAAEIEIMASKHQEQGGALTLVTLTLRHSKKNPLALTFGTVNKAWGKVAAGKTWINFMNKHGIEGNVRVTEVTYGGQNGWHPHLHILFFHKKGLDKHEVAAWKTYLYDRWAKYVVALGCQLPTKLRGVDIRPAGQDGKVVAQYLAKAQDAGSDSVEKRDAKRQAIGNEMARADFKDGRAGNITPFQLLDSNGKKSQELWIEYYWATKGKRLFGYSGKLRERYLEDPDKSDEEIIDETEQKILLFTINGKAYDLFKDSWQTQARILEAAEEGRISDAHDLAGPLADESVYIYPSDEDSETKESTKDESSEMESIREQSLRQNMREFLETGKVTKLMTMEDPKTHEMVECFDAFKSQYWENFVKRHEGTDMWNEIESSVQDSMSSTDSGTTLKKLNKPTARKARS